KCKPIAGKGDQGCGIIWRVKDADNYYITRANALEDNVHLYHVVKGKRDRFAGWNGKVTSGAWHELAMEMVGDHIQVFFDGTKVAVAERGQLEIELGPIGLLREGPERFLVVPALIANVGIADHLELVLEGRHQFLLGEAAGAARARLVDTALSLKAVVRQ